METYRITKRNAGPDAWETTHDGVFVFHGYVQWCFKSEDRELRYSRLEDGILALAPAIFVME